MDKIKITDTTFRDGHQSILATRLRTADMEPVASDMDSVGFHSLEVWGGATFDVATRFLAEDPWERLRLFKKLMPNTPLMMLLRGQSLVGYRAYADDIVDSFIKHAGDSGIDIFRVFDALNDPYNLESAVNSIKTSGKHAQITVCYSVTEGGRLGGDIYNLDYYLKKAKLFEDMGADSICIKDMAGLLAPYDAFELVTALKNTVDVPIQLHTHYTSGMASMTAIKAIEAGLDVLDTCISPLALRTAQPALEPLLMTLQGTERDPQLDMNLLLKIGDYFESILHKYSEHLNSSRVSVIDPRVLSHQIPGGMISNLVSQLIETDALEKLDDVFDEIPRTRSDLGFPPLVTPISQMVGTQSVQNVLFGRYKMVSSQIKDYVYGLYGRPPVELNSKFVNMILKGYEKGESPISERPADLIDPEFQKASDAIKEISTDLDDILTYALYPMTGLKFIRIKYGLEPIPEEMKDKPDAGKNPQITTGADLDEMPSVDPKIQVTDSKSFRARAFNVYVDDKVHRIVVDPIDLNSSGQTYESSGTEVESDFKDTQSTQNRETTGSAGESYVVAPIPGVVLNYCVEIGETIKSGDAVVLLEAMKMENSIPSPKHGTVKALNFSPGDNVSKGDVLAVIVPSKV